MILLSHFAVFPAEYARLTEPPCPTPTMILYRTVLWLWKKAYEQEEALLFA